MTALATITADNWQTTRDAIHAYARVIGIIRGTYAPREKHWWHISLRPMADGWTTTPFQIGGNMVEIMLNLKRDYVDIALASGGNFNLTLRGQSALELYGEIQGAFSVAGIDLAVETGKFRTDAIPYESEAADQIRIVQLQCALILQQLKGRFRLESSPVQLWPHHFDMSLVWLSGNLINGQDPADEEHADEQMSFGFGMGDGLVPEPYFYANAYPMPDGLRETKLPAGYWPAEGFGGALLKHSDANSAETVLSFFQAIYQEGKARMLPVASG